MTQDEWMEQVGKVVYDPNTGLAYTVSGVTVSPCVILQDAYGRQNIFGIDSPNAQPFLVDRRGTGERRRNLKAEDMTAMEARRNSERAANAIKPGDGSRRIGKGVYSRPQPGDPDHPESEK